MKTVQLTQSEIQYILGCIEVDLGYFETDPQMVDLVVRIKNIRNELTKK